MWMIIREPAIAVIRQYRGIMTECACASRRNQLIFEANLLARKSP
jgi:hypothetical protein